MSGLVKLDLGLLQDTLPAFEKAYNGEPLQIVSEIAASVKDSGDSNRISEEFLENCVKFQQQFNLLTDSAKVAMEDLKAVIDISEYQANKANVGEVSNKDVSFESSKIDSSAVIRG